MPAECNIGLKDFPDGILNDGKENPIKAIMGESCHIQVENARCFLSNIDPVCHSEGSDNEVTGEDIQTAHLINSRNGLLL